MGARVTPPGPVDGPITIYGPRGASRAMVPDLVSGMGPTQNIGIVAMANLDVGVGSVASITSEPPKAKKESIVKAKYKKSYKPLGGLCGDDMSAELTAATSTSRDGKYALDLKILHDIAVQNGVWKISYGKLNPGQQRMTIGNCLRHKIERGEKVTVGRRVWDPEKDAEDVR